jgi:uncharacterized protein (TIGR02246 family)
MVAALFDAWDDGDAAGVAALFSSNGRWTDPSGTTLAGPPSVMAAAYTAWRNWEPWSIHWLSNEQIVVTEPGRCRGSWLWSAASNIEGGQMAAWSGGDLSVDAVRREGRWLIESVAATARYRSGYDKGWLAEPLVPAPTLNVPTGDGTPRSGEPPDTGTASASLDELSSEVELRLLMGQFIEDLEAGRPASTVVSHWVPDGILTLGDGSGGSAKGVDAIAELIGREQAELSATMRMLFSESIEVSGSLASCRWRDLWTGVRDGRAVWVSHRYVVDAVRGSEGWRFMRMDRRRLLDCTYNEGWPVEGNSTTETRCP